MSRFLRQVALPVFAAGCCVGVAQAGERRVLPQCNTIVLDQALAAVSAADIAAEQAWDECRSFGDLRDRQRQLRARLLESVGALPAKCSLDARTVGRVERDGYAIEKVLFASEPQHHVTAHLFLPDPERFPGRRPGIVLPCGHSCHGKAEASYQRGALMAAQRGLVVLLYDPLDQGERRQSRANGQLWGCAAHNAVGRRAELLGWSMVRFRLRDGLRALDYLESRPEVDATRLGVMGHSGGGTMTSWIMGLEDRVKCAAPSGFLTTLRDVCREIGPQDAEQCVFGELAFGFNHLGHILLRAPSPVLMCSSHGDFFPITGALETADRAAKTYARFGHPDGFRLSDVTGPHHWHESTRQCAVDFMDWKLQRGPAPKRMEEYRALDYGFSESAVDTALSYVPRNLADVRTNLWAANVTPTGSTLDLPGERTVYDLMRDEAARQRSVRGQLAPDVVRSVAGIRKVEDIHYVSQGGNVLLAEDGAPVVLHVQAGASAQRGSGTVLFVSEDGAAPVFAANRVIAADIRGFGENGTVKHVFYGVNKADEELSVLYHLLGQKLVGKRAEDILAAAQFAGDRPKLVAKGRAAIPAAHAYYTAPELFSGIELQDPPPSWESFLATDNEGGQFADIVRGAWSHYDWSDLVPPKRGQSPDHNGDSPRKNGDSPQIKTGTVPM